MEGYSWKSPSADNAQGVKNTAARLSEKVGGSSRTFDSRRVKEGWPAFQVVRNADIQIEAAEKAHDVDLDSLARTAEHAWFPVPGPGTESAAGEQPPPLPPPPGFTPEVLSTCGHNLLGSSPPR